ncbi:hypothetical protein C7999DRAFT_10284 [Corynascus novoguineensis]|uniref:Kynurenine formamidase n=1 Tax=Corynascus novoguineensis TaxID=1126955 RepID=A0AAN7D1J3_9PEZI|nr:hypothetical protein C7999DRAFT_10284 [Corynascus novoguineensis]
MQSYCENGNNGKPAADWSVWASVPWTAVSGPCPGTANVNGTGAGTGSRAEVPIIGWFKSGVPYLPPGKAAPLQTLDVWVPNPQHTAANPTVPDPSSLPSPPDASTWIIYIHGGAWRDPLVSSASFTPAATDLLLRSAQARVASGGPSRLAGLVSINYRLSPHPSYPSSPDDLSHQAKHPDHIADILAALTFFRRCLSAARTERGEEGGGAENQKWIFTGHSCGATLAFQSVMAPSRWGLDLSPAANKTTTTTTLTTPGIRPAAIVGFNGLYDLAGFIASPPAGYAHLREAYREFVAGAFGGPKRRGGGGCAGDGEEEEEAVFAAWRAVCPATADGAWVGEWLGEEEEEDDNEESEGGKRGGKEEEKKGVVVLVQSREDTLVPWRQVEVMRARLEWEARVEVRVLEAGGDHDDLWKDGRRIAEVLWELVDEM